MRELFSVLAGTACVLALAGCGGGGSSSGDAGGSGGGSNPPVEQPVQPPVQPPVLQPNQTWLSIEPAVKVVATATGESRWISFSATASKTIEGVVNAAVVDPKGLVMPDAFIIRNSDTRYSAELRTASNLPAGEHNTNLELRLCYDDPTVCRNPVDGSPWKIPLTVSVKQVINAGGALSQLPGVSNWHTLQGNAAHNAYIAARFDAAKFSRRWVSAGLAHSDGPLGLVQDNGRVFAVRSGIRAENSTLVAFSEDSGQQLWKYDFGLLYHVNPPAAAGGRVFVTSTGYPGGWLWVFDQVTGALLQKAAIAGQWGNYGPPTVYGESLYTTAGFYGGLGKFGMVTYAWQWLARASAADNWTPAIDGTHAYVYIHRWLYAYRTDDGSPAYEIVNNDLANNEDYAVAPALSGQDAYVIQGDRLMAFDLANRGKKWTVANAALGQPVYANGVVYARVREGSAIEARNAATGALLWQSEPFGQNAGEGPFGGLILTDNLAFVSKPYETVAIDLASHRVLWRYPSGGKLALSNLGVLYIASDNSAIVAINLR